jgi:hypothetical protein
MSRLIKSCLLLIFICLLVAPFSVHAAADLSPKEMGSYSPSEYYLLKGLYEYVTNPANIDWSDPNEYFLKKHNAENRKSKTMDVYVWVNMVTNLVKKYTSSSFFYLPEDVNGFVSYYNFMTEVQESAKKGTKINPKTLESAGALAFFYNVYNYPLSNMPASAVDGAKNLASKILDAPTANAQGLGFTKLNVTGKGGNVKTITALWTASRNASYMVMIVLLIATGFMIMFKQQVSPQASVTVQMILPKLFFAMLAGTFSLAIVGLVIDGVYVSISAIVGLYTISSGAGITSLFSDPGGAIKILQNADSQYIGVVFMGYYLKSAWEVISNTFLNTIYSTAAISASVPVIPAYYQVRGIIYGIEIGLVIWALWANLKIIYTLYMAYIQLIILTIIGPLQIMMDIIPSKEPQGFEPWIKCVIGNASVFVSTAVIVIVMQAIFNFGAPSSGADACGSNCTPISDTLNINGLFSEKDKGFTLPFLGGSDQLAGDITQLGDKTLGGKFLLGTGATIDRDGIIIHPGGDTGVTIDFGWLGGGKKDLGAFLNEFIAGPSKKAFESKIIGKVMNNTGYTFLLVGFMNLVPTLITTVKTNLCKGSKDINFDTALKPLQDALNQFTSLKPFKLI